MYNIDVKAKNQSVKVNGKVVNKPSEITQTLFECQMCQKRFPSVDEIRLHCEEHRREAEKVQNKLIPEDEVVCLDDSIGMTYKIFFFNSTMYLYSTMYLLSYSTAS